MENSKNNIEMIVNSIGKTDKQFAMALIWSAAIIFWITFILLKFASADKGILNLLIGFMTGTAATILGVYFVTQMNKKPNQPGDNPNEDVAVTNIGNQQVSQ